MKILHISMGLPPFRTGGLNRYCADIMGQQVKDGHTVALLYPGEFTLDGKVRIRRENNEKFQLFRILNPLPLALTNGIGGPSRYVKKADGQEYEKFLRRLAPDIIHVHSLQGIHQEFFDVAAARKIRMVFTTHDYYPFCPRCVLLDAQGALCTGPDPAKCALCNAGRGLSKKQELIMQSQLYKKLKYSSLMTAVRKKQRTKTNETTSSEGRLLSAAPEEYAALSAYYASMIEKMDLIHCNSEMAKEEYEKQFSNLNDQVLPITHAGLTEQSHSVPDKETLRIGFLGGTAPYKGVKLLLQAAFLLDQLGVSSWELSLYGGDFSSLSTDSRIHSCGYFSPKEEDLVWNSFDVLAVPSLWKETFGFVVEEAIARHVPVVCSDLVGAKMLLSQDMIYPHDSPEQLAAALKSAWKNPTYVTKKPVFSIEEHCKMLESLYL